MKHKNKKVKAAIALKSKRTRKSNPVSAHKIGSERLLKGDALSSVSALPSDHFSLIISSPPYNIGKIYERGKRLSLGDYRAWQDKIAAQLVRCLKKDGSLCWQVTTTNINGLVGCIRRFVRRGKLRTVPQYIAALDGLDKFPFKNYKSSQYNKLAQELYDRYFASARERSASHR